MDGDGLKKFLAILVVVMSLGMNLWLLMTRPVCEECLECEECPECPPPLECEECEACEICEECEECEECKKCPTGGTGTGGSSSKDYRTDDCSGLTVEQCFYRLNRYNDCQWTGPRYTGHCESR